MLTRLVVKCTLLLVLLGTIAACDSLPEDVENQAAQIDRDLNALGQTLAARESEFTALQNNEAEWAFFQTYAEGENWGEQLAAAGRDLANLRGRYNEEVTPLLEKDESADAERVRQLLESIQENFAVVRASINAVDTRMKLLREGYENAPTWIADARTYVENIETLVNAVEPVREEAKADFPDRSSDIDERFVPLTRLLREAQEALATAEAEYAKHEAGGNADYAAFADSYSLAKAHNEAAVAEDASYREQLASLARDYTTILRDMKVEYAVVISRSSWDNCCDGASYERDTPYAEVRISQADYEYLFGLSQGESEGSQGNLARRYDNWGWGFEVFIDNDVWEHLGINMDASWPNGHDDSVFWIEDLFPVYYHRYAEVSGATVVEGDWVEVDEDEFGAHVDNFGMAIESKPLGLFDDEAIAEATPPGMAMVGDERYGRWESDGQGGERWSFLETYAFYHLMFGGSGNHYYYRDDYNSYRGWRSDRVAGSGSYGWYGQNRSTPTFGSSGSVTANSPAYRSSPFASAGGVTAVPQSVRDAGAAARARGPGGGGK